MGTPVPGLGRVPLTDEPVPGLGPDPDNLARARQLLLQSILQQGGSFTEDGVAAGAISSFEEARAYLATQVQGKMLSDQSNQLGAMSRFLRGSARGLAAPLQLLGVVPPYEEEDLGAAGLVGDLTGFGLGFLPFYRGASAVTKAVGLAQLTPRIAQILAGTGAFMGFEAGTAEVPEELPEKLKTGLVWGLVGEAAIQAIGLSRAWRRANGLKDDVPIGDGVEVGSKEFSEAAEQVSRDLPESIPPEIIDAELNIQLGQHPILEDAIEAAHQTLREQGPNVDQVWARFTAQYKGRPAIILTRDVKALQKGLAKSAPTARLAFSKPRKAGPGSEISRVLMVPQGVEEEILFTSMRKLVSPTIEDDQIYSILRKFRRGEKVPNEDIELFFGGLRPDPFGTPRRVAVRPAAELRELVDQGHVSHRALTEKGAESYRKIPFVSAADDISTKDFDVTLTVNTTRTDSRWRSAAHEYTHFLTDVGFGDLIVEGGGWKMKPGSVKKVLRARNEDELQQLIGELREVSIESAVMDLGEDIARLERKGLGHLIMPTARSNPRAHTRAEMLQDPGYWFSDHEMLSRLMEHMVADLRTTRRIAPLATERMLGVIKEYSPLLDDLVLSQEATFFSRMMEARSLEGVTKTVASKLFDQKKMIAEFERYGFWKGERVKYKGRDAEVVALLNKEQQNARQAFSPYITIRQDGRNFAVRKSQLTVPNLQNFARDRMAAVKLVKRAMDKPLDHVTIPMYDGPITRRVLVDLRDFERTSDFDGWVRSNVKDLAERKSRSSRMGGIVEAIQLKGAKGIVWDDNGVMKILIADEKVMVAGDGFPAVVEAASIHMKDALYQMFEVPFRDIARARLREVGVGRGELDDLMRLIELETDSRLRGLVDSSVKADMEAASRALSDLIDDTPEELASRAGYVAERLEGGRFAIRDLEGTRLGVAESGDEALEYISSLGENAARGFDDDLLSVPTLKFLNDFGHHPGSTYRGQRVVRRMPGESQTGIEVEGIGGGTPRGPAGQFVQGETPPDDLTKRLIQISENLQDSTPEVFARELINEGFSQSEILKALQDRYGILEGEARGHLSVAAMTNPGVTNEARGLSISLNSMQGQAPVMRPPRPGEQMEFVEAEARFIGSATDILTRRTGLIKEGAPGGLIEAGSLAFPWATALENVAIAIERTMGLPAYSKIFKPLQDGIVAVDNRYLTQAVERFGNLPWVGKLKKLEEKRYALGKRLRAQQRAINKRDLGSVRGMISRRGFKSMFEEEGQRLIELTQVVSKEELERVPGLLDPVSLQFSKEMERLAIRDEIPRLFALSSLINKQVTLGKRSLGMKGRIPEMVQQVTAAQAGQRLSRPEIIKRLYQAGSITKAEMDALPVIENYLAQTGVAQGMKINHPAGIRHAMVPRLGKGSTSRRAELEKKWQIGDLERGIAKDLDDIVAAVADEVNGTVGGGFNSAEFSQVFWPVFKDMMAQGLSPDAAMWADMPIMSAWAIPRFKSGELSLYIKDPVRYAHKLVRGELMRQEFDPFLKEANEARKLLMAKDERLGRIMGDYMFELQGHSHSSFGKINNIIQTGMRALGHEVDDDWTRRVVNSLTIHVYGATIPFRPAIIARNYFQPAQMIAPIIGGRFFKKGVDRATKGINKNFEADYSRAIKAGAVQQNHTPVEFQDELRNATVLLPRRFKMLMDKGFEYYASADQWGRAIAFHGMHERVNWALKRVGNLPEIGTENWSRFRQLAKIDTFEQPIIDEFERLWQAGQFEGAKDFIGTALARKTIFRYGHANHPAGWGSVYGRMFGQFGTWPIQYKDYMLQGIARGSAKDRAEFLATHFAINAGVVVGGAELMGLNLMSWVSFPSLQYTGGPFADIMLDMAQMMSGSDTEKRLAKQDLLSQFPTFQDPRTIFIPGAYAFGDVVRAWQNESDPARMFGGALGLKFIGPQENVYWDWLPDSLTPRRFR